MRQRQLGDGGGNGREELRVTGRTQGPVATGRDKAVPMMGTSAMNTLRMEFATLRERNTRVYARGTAELREAPAGPQGPAAGAEARALPRRPCPRIPAARPASPGAASSRARPPRAHARSVFSMMNLTFSSVSSVMRTVGWLAYGMAAPLRPGPARRPAPVRPRPLAAAASRRTRPVRPVPAPLPPPPPVRPQKESVPG